MYKGILYLLLATFTFALVNLGVKVLSEPNLILPDAQHYPAHELVFFRSVISLSICIAVIRKQRIPFFGNNKKWLITRGLAGATALYLFFLTLQHMPMGIATIVQYLSPVFTIIIAIFLLRETVKPIQWLFIGISLSGIVVIGLDSDDASAVPAGWLLVGVLSAFFAGIAYNAIMKCRNTDAPITVVMYFPLLAGPVTLAACIFYDFVMPRGWEWLVLLLIGVLTQIAQVSMTSAFNADSASTIAPLKYLGSVYALLIGFFIFNETISLIAIMGMILIVIGVILNTWIRKIRPAKEVLNHAAEPGK